ncbi:Putative esterase YheT [Galdieria sulphuraria]|nr:Putative esterase YheT [Galdieria sulphuraria]
MRTYHPPSFEPPVWTRLGGHFQTIFGSIFPVPNIKYDKRRRFCTHDGDFFDVDIVLGHNKLNPYVVVCHGLESSAYSSHTLRIVERFVALGWNVFAINYRGCSGVPNRTLRTYHVGFTEDVDLLTKTIYEETEGSCTIYLAGFSLGGNIIIKFLGATVACVPLNPFYCQPKADRGISKVIYVRRFLSSFKQKAEEQHKRFPKAFDIQRVRSITTIGELDDYYISKGRLL